MTKQNYILAAESRKEKNKNLKKIRESGFIPGVLYGHNVEPISLSINYSAFEKILSKAGESSLIDLNIDKKDSVKVLVQDYQLDPKTNQFIHVDFLQIKMDEKITAEIELKFIGESPAVKELSGILVTNTDKVNVECLPGDLVHEIEVNISSLKTFDDAIHISSINPPKGIKILNNPEETVVLVQTPRTEEEIKTLDEKPQDNKPEQSLETEKAAENDSAEK